MSRGACVTVVSLSCYCRTTVAPQLWVTRTFDSELLEYKEGPIYWVSDVRGQFSQQNILKHARLHPHESNKITGRYPLQLLYQCTILHKHQAQFDLGLYSPTSGVSLVPMLFMGSNQR